MRVVVRNGGPFGAALATEVHANLRIDLDDPAIGRAGFSVGAGRSLTAVWTADDLHSGVRRATVQWRHGGAWRTLGSVEATDGAGAMTVDGSTLPAGEQAVRILVSDGAGNVATKAGTVTLPAGGVGSVASDPLGRLRAAKITVHLAGARRVARGGRIVLLRRLSAGATALLSRALRDAHGQPIVGAEVQARGHRGRVVGRGLTGRAGRFSFKIRPVGGGVLRVGVASGTALLPRGGQTPVVLELRPRLEFGASAQVVAVGGTALFSGRLTPSPGALGLGGRKSVVLEWLDPVRRTWRPVVNHRLRADGTFSIPWTFNVRSLTIPMRVTVPQEIGWPLLPARSRVLRVRVPR